MGWTLVIGWRVVIDVYLFYLIDEALLCPVTDELVVL